MTNLCFFELLPVVPTRGQNTDKVGKLRLSKIAGMVFLFCVATAIAAPAQTFTTLLSFDGTDGSGPTAALVQGTDGNLYGTTSAGGVSSRCTNGCGTVLKITPQGTLTTLHSFDFTDGYRPEALVQAANGNFYGTTNTGGAHTYGTVFKITPQGTLTTLYSFCAQTPPNCTDGADPQAALVQATDGNLYGTTSDGGIGVGTFFKVTPSGTLTTLHIFGTGNGEGFNPMGALVQATDGNFYGTTNTGGAFANDQGTVFKITPSGALTTLHTFDYVADFANGAYPVAGLVQGTDGNFYGTTSDGGNGNQEVGGAGTIFKITPSGSFTILHRFSGTDGGQPLAGLIQATDGNFYGTTKTGGTKEFGTVFKITPGGTLTTLYSFGSQSGCTDGYFPLAGLIQDTNGDLYGTTAGGTTTGTCQQSNGTVFRLSVGLRPFVSFMRSSGKVGQTVQILGQGLTGATKVSFNGANAAFAVKSETYLTATVPAGATTGFVTVATPGSTLKSNQKFRVTPQISSFSPTTGPADTTVVITGDSLTGTTEVVFACGKKATFTVDSDTQITATVPAGAMTGAINVVTPGGHVGSASSFTVIP